MSILGKELALICSQPRLKVRDPQSLDKVKPVENEMALPASGFKLTTCARVCWVLHEELYLSELPDNARAALLYLFTQSAIGAGIIKNNN